MDPRAPRNAGSSTHALELRGVTADYGKVEVLHQLSIAVPRATTVALLGPNGAGKSTTLGAISGTVEVFGGDILLEGQSLKRLPTHARARLGLTLIPEGRGIFPALSVAANLEIACDSVRGVSVAWKRQQRDRVLALFPRLQERIQQCAGTMSGGEQQMLAVSRALVAAPKVLLMDEISMGLAPQIVELLFDAVAALKAEGTTIVLVEQYLTYALRCADICYLLGKGQIVFVGESDELRNVGAASAGYV